jgi:hypothetical protein
MASTFSNNIVSSLQSLSFFSPIIVLISLLIYSLLSGNIFKLLFYYLWVFVITFVRFIVYKITNSGQTTNVTQNIINPICNQAASNLFIPNDFTFSTYLLSFTMIYLTLPSIIYSSQNKVSTVNYSILIFYLVYIFFDIYIKSSLSCVSSLFNKQIMADLFGGLLIGGIISGAIMYPTTLKQYTYFMEDKMKVVPKEQKFKCEIKRKKIV